MCSSKTAHQFHLQTNLKSRIVPKPHKIQKSTSISHSTHLFKTPIKITSNKLSENSQLTITRPKSPIKPFKNKHFTELNPNNQILHQIKHRKYKTIATIKRHKIP